MKKLKLEIVSSIKNRKINVFFLFVLFSFATLIVTKLSKTYTNTMSFDTEKTNVPDDIVILNDTLKLDIVLKTHGFKWLSYYINPPKIKIDFNKDVYKKDGDFVWSKSSAYLKNTQFDDQVELLSIISDSLFFHYDVNLVKKVPIKTQVEINFSPGYDRSSNITTDPDSVVVIGPNKWVSRLQSLRTRKVTFEDVKTNFSAKVKLKLPDNTLGLKFSEDEVLITAKVEKFTEGTLVVPISIINKPADTELKYFPKTVTVSYYVSLSDYPNITSNDFRVVCDYNNISLNHFFLIPVFETIPEQVKNAKINQQRIEYIISQ